MRVLRLIKKFWWIPIIPIGIVFTWFLKGYIKGKKQGEEYLNTIIEHDEELLKI